MGHVKNGFVPYSKLVLILLGCAGLLGGAGTLLASSIRADTVRVVELQARDLSTHIALSDQRFATIERILQEIRSDVKEIKKR